MILALAALWTVAAWYWYACLCMHACGPRMPREEVRQETPAVVTPAAPVVATAASTWAEVTAKPIVLYFKVNSDEAITENVATKLADIVSYMKANPTSQITVTGHTNVHSSQAYTNKLGLERAEATKQMLVSLGAPAAQIFTQSKGQTQLAASSKTAEGRYLNRRVVISVIK